MNQSLRLGLRHDLRLNHDQKLQLKNLLLLEQRLRHPGYPETVRGLDGLKVAHEILGKSEATGILIGGLAEKVWNRNTKAEDLDKHKDVDVMVLDDHFYQDKDFEGGVDWWTPKEAELEITDDYGSKSILPHYRW
ncbi:MAG: hypothetical protein AABY07_08635, partial [Nanoarchaeota archaeon]